MPVDEKEIKKRDPDRTSRTILNAAIEEFTEVGLGGARVDRIAEKAGVNKRMLYHYFGNKDDLFLAALEEIYVRIRNAEHALDLEHASPDEAIRKLVTFTWNYFIENPSFISVLNNENLHKAEHLKRSFKIKTLHSPFIEMIDGVLRTGVEEGVFRDDADAVQLYISIASLGYFYLSNAHTLSTIFDRDLMADDALAERLTHITEVVLGYLRK